MCWKKIIIFYTFKKYMLLIFSRWRSNLYKTKCQWEKVCAASGACLKPTFNSVAALSATLKSIHLQKPTKTIQNTSWIMHVRFLWIYKNAHTHWVISALPSFFHQYILLLCLYCFASAAYSSHLNSILAIVRAELNSAAWVIYYK